MRGYDTMIISLCTGSLLMTVFLLGQEEGCYKLPHRQPQESSELRSDCKELNDDIVKPYTKPWKKLNKSYQEFRELNDDIVKRYSKPWTKHEKSYQEFRHQLHSKCNGSDEAIISRANTPLGSVISGINKYVVTTATYQLFPEVSPLSNYLYETCAVVGNGGILHNSSCGKMIDSSDFVIRCNLPPLFDGFEDHVGTKSDLVTANPTIFEKVFGSKPEHQRLLLEKMYPFKDSLVLIPAFSYQTNLVLRAVKALQHFESPARPVFLNPKYMDRLKLFWSSRGVNARRLSSGLMMVSMALEVCKNVRVYGFWPFSHHPFNQQFLRHHYYDDVPPKAQFHAMPVEFQHLLQLHLQGVIRLQLGNCGS